MPILAVVEAVPMWKEWLEQCSEVMPEMQRTLCRCFWNQNWVAIFLVLVRNNGC